MPYSCVEAPMPAEILYAGKFLKLMREGRWEYVQRVTRDHAVIIIGLTPRQEVVLIEQPRIPAGGHVIEWPAGLVGDSAATADEALVETARRELLEETGYTAERFVQIFAGPPSPGIASETITWFRAHGLQKVGPGGGEGGENITVHAIPLREVDDWLDRWQADGGKVDPKVYAGLYFLLREIAAD
jgi:ADP-ribose pyrophosphatase